MDDRSCCCPSLPMVRVFMPPIPARPHQVELLLCGHHYRVSQQALAAAGARIEILPSAHAADGSVLALM